MAKSFASTYQKRENSPGFLAEQMAVTLLAELNERMRTLGISNSDLARAAGVSPAYITKLFRGPSNVSLETVAKLALAVGCQPHLHIAVEKPVSSQASRKVNRNREGECHASL